MTGVGVIVATVVVVCPHHEDEVLVEHQLTASGHTQVANMRGFEEEYVTAEPFDAGAMLDYRERTHPLLGFTPPVASTEGDDTPHARFRYACPRPSCPVDAQVRADGVTGLRAQLRAALDGMRAAGLQRMTITNVDGPWRVVSTPGPP